ncbi:hypothetical protein [Aminobacterium colombiense]|uniref:Uncharacterized protein n=1 Tax=Aminobacterium colombiense (strain DSM 12261 / ALA-1) TaxID=572547 RepID=D5EFD0_AMICL|nr:hypothetical protein [Aminobacterium colombiense]ADE57262.1 hypothetical protein Amico_1139 [Aminobacterium colombiense DSM 12261]
MFLKHSTRKFFELLAKSGVVSGPYYFKGIWFAKREASSLLSAICGADERKRLSARYQDISIRDVQKLSAFVEEA